MAARDVDTYLTGIGSRLPVTGGITKRPPYEQMKHANGNIPEILASAA